MPLNEIERKQIKSLWDSYASQRELIKQRREYYEGKHKSRTGSYADGTAKTSRVSNWIKYITNRYIGALTTQSYQLTEDISKFPSINRKQGIIEKAVNVIKNYSDNKDKENIKQGIAYYGEVFKQNNLKAKDICNLKNAYLYGYSVELHDYNQGGGINITIRPPDQWAISFDENDKVNLAVCRVTIKANTFFMGEFVSNETLYQYIYTPKLITLEKISGSEIIEISQTANVYGQVPIVVWQLNENRTTNIPDSLIGQNDEWNEVNSASGDDIRYNSNSLLVMPGISPQHVKENETNIISRRAMGSSDPGFKPYFLQKGNDVVRIESHLKQTREIICMDGEVPDIEQIVGAVGATSGIALQLKFLPMSQAAENFIPYLEKGLRERIDLINIISTKLNGIKIRDYKVNIQVTLPYNRLEEWQAIGSLKGEVSHRTRLELLRDIEDPEAEIERIKSEQENPIATPEAEAMADTQKKMGQQEAIEQVVMPANELAMNELQNKMNQMARDNIKKII